MGNKNYITYLWAVAVGVNQGNNADNTALLSNTLWDGNTAGRTPAEILAISKTTISPAGALKFVYAGKAVVQHSIFQNNIGGTAGGAIGFSGPGSLTLKNDLFRNNYC
eukprot:COSAG05_NODE_3932_length_1768_cov_1.053925_1_plen_108_part_00